MHKFYLLCCCLLSSGCASLASNTDELSAPSALPAQCHIPLQQHIDELAMLHMKNQQMSGLVAAVLTADRQRHIFSYGVTGGEQSTPVNGDTLFAVGSITKGFTAESLALLVARGELQWDDSLEERIGDKVWLSDDAQRITLLQLASHSAGLPPLSSDLSPAADELDSGDFMEYFGEYEKPAHTRVVESSLGYAMLNLVISINSLRTTQDIASQHIIAPLGLQHTGYQPQALPGYAQRARGYPVKPANAMPNEPFSGYMVATTGLWSSASDLLSWLTAHLYGSGNEMLDRAFADTLRVRVRPTTGDNAALAWRSKQINGQTLLYQSGFIGGYASYVGIDLQHKHAVVVLQNRSDGDNTIGQNVLLNLAAKGDCEGTDPKI